jgi:hypothetical protein
VTFWEGEIVDAKNYTFFTGKWEASWVFMFFLYHPKTCPGVSKHSKLTFKNIFLLFCRADDDIRHWSKFPSFMPLLVIGYLLVIDLLSIIMNLWMIFFFISHYALPAESDWDRWWQVVRPEQLCSYIYGMALPDTFIYQCISIFIYHFSDAACRGGRSNTLSMLELTVA